MKIAVIGTGYVGLVSAVCFAELGHTVIGVDVDQKKVEMLQRGESPIYEPGLEEMLKANSAAGRLSFCSSLKEALPECAIVFSAVATPPGEGYKADLRAVFSVAESVATLATSNLVFVNKSTVPVGTAKQCESRMQSVLRKRGIALRIPVVSNPEFLREGMAVSDTMMPDRIVVGIGSSGHLEETEARHLLEELYRPITRVGKPLLFMNRESAEILKYASNAFLATKISFINMLTELSEVTGANIRDIAKGMGLDHRIGPKFLHAGIGYGGSCFPKDVKALLATAEEYDVPMPIVEATDRVNQLQRQRFIQNILSTLKKTSHVAVWGLSFKPKTDDMREAPSIDVITALLAAGHTVTAFDPVAIEKAKPLLPASVSYATSALEAGKNADAIILLTEWDIFRGVDLAALKSAMSGDLLFDGRNVYEPEDVSSQGLRYVGVGV